MTHDILIRGGTIVDGTGRAPFQVLTPVVGRLAELAGSDGILELPAAAFARQPDLIALERRFGEPTPDARCAALRLLKGPGGGPRG